MRAIGFMQGQRGDLILSTVVARAFKQAHPNATLVLGINQRYADMAPLFFQHPSYDSIHVWDRYDGWPGPEDEAYLKRAGYDLVFSAMPKRANEATWWRTEHQAANACTTYGLTPPQDIQCQLNPWFAPYLDTSLKGYVAFNYIGGFYAGYPNAKSYSPERAASIVDAIKSLGYKVLVLGDPAEPPLAGTERRPLSYVESVKAMLGCKAFVGIDSGLTWAASAYSFPTLACYADDYYGEHVTSIQPVNPRAIYHSAATLDAIPLDSLLHSLTMLLS